LNLVYVVGLESSYTHTSVEEVGKLTVEDATNKMLYYIFLYIFLSTPIVFNCSSNFL